MLCRGHASAILGVCASQGTAQPMGERRRAVAHAETERRSGRRHAPAAQRRVLPSFPAILDILDVLVQAPKPSSSPDSLSLPRSVSSSSVPPWTELEHQAFIDQIREPPPWIPNLLRPKLPCLPSFLPNPSNHSPNPHLAGNRGFPDRWSFSWKAGPSHAQHPWWDSPHRVGRVGSSPAVGGEAGFTADGNGAPHRRPWHCLDMACVPLVAWEEGHPLPDQWGRLDRGVK